MCGIILCLNQPSIAATDNVEPTNLFTLDIESLMHVKVSVASKRDENIYDAPGVVSVMTDTDIERFGANSLSDVIARFPNVYKWGSEVFRNNTTSIRGQTLTHVDNTVLLLLNGRPMRESFGGGLNLAIYESFPVEAIKRIEMIRGPGSVLYGSNAFSGVINIITKSPADGGENYQVSSSYGSFNTQAYQVAMTKQIGEVGTVFSLSSRNEDGWNFAFTDAAGNHGEEKHGNDTHGVFIQSKYKGLTLTGFVGYSRYDELDTGMTLPASQRLHQRHFVDAQYEHQLSERWGTTLNLTFNNWESQNSEDATDGLFEISFNGQLTDDIELVTGASIDHHNSTVTDASTSRLSTSYYLQGEYRVLNWLTLVGGLQLNKPDDIDLDLSPRLGTIIRFNENWRAKLLYGEAFRSPYSLETSISVPGILVGSSDLEAETISTFDAQLLYNNHDYSSALTFYQSKQKDTIVRSGARPATFINGGEVNYWGIEWEGRIQLGSHWDIQGSLTYQAGEDEADNEDVGLVPHYMAKIGVSYNSGKGYQIGVFNSYFSDAAQIEDISNAAVVNSTADAYNWLTFKASLNLRDFTGNSTLPDIDFDLYGENLLNEDVHFPELIRKQINTVPLHGGRAVYFTVKLKF